MDISSFSSDGEVDHGGHERLITISMVRPGKTLVDLVKTYSKTGQSVAWVGCETVVFTTPFEKVSGLDVVTVSDGELQTGEGVVHFGFL
jgi:hypothetical protein